ncbi:MAG: four helix bundle protein [Candidatus Peribacteria bacterium]|nr:MAG: four helix bundle protein [Candidatus Peribacteria bacterium]
MYGLSKNKEYYIITDSIKQIIKSATSIGANLHEADVAITKKKFNRILYIALREAKETEYWFSVFEE